MQTKTKPHQLASMLHFFKGALNKPRNGVVTGPQPNPIKKRMDYETRITVETPRLTDKYSQMANGEIRRVDSKIRDGSGKSRRRRMIIERRLSRGSFYKIIHEKMQATQ